jgi:hypothetical protein
MAEVERGGDLTVAVRQHGGHRIAEELGVDDVPAAVAGREIEQALAGPDMKPMCHSSLHSSGQPPVRA